MAKGRQAGNAEPGDAERIARRRRMVAELRLNGMTQVEIPAALYKAGEFHVTGVGPDGKPEGAPWDQSTISKDLAVVRKGWMTDAAADLTEHRARQLAEIFWLRRKAKTRENLNVVANTIELEMRLLGTAQPLKIEVTIEVLEIFYAVVKQLEGIGADPAEVLNDLYNEIARQAIEARQQILSLPGGGADFSSADADD